MVEIIVHYSLPSDDKRFVTTLIIKHWLMAFYYCRYIISRCVLIEILQTHWDISIEDYTELSETMKRASATVGAIIQCRNHFVENGIHAIQNEYIPIFKDALGGHALPRVVPGMFETFATATTAFQYVHEETKVIYNDLTTNNTFVTNYKLVK